MSGGGARRPLVVGNWKMNLTETFAVKLADAVIERVGGSAAEVGIAPATVALHSVGEHLRGTPVALASQNHHWEEKGAFTGETAPGMLAELGVRFAIVGHSERRNVFGETDEMVRKKLAAARRHGLVPIVCVGEQEVERDDGRTLAVVERQVRIALSDVVDPSPDALVVAYEPVWAIGTGRTPTAAQVQDVHEAIRRRLDEIVGSEVASGVRVLYGGSVTPRNAGELLEVPDVDGALVGGASLDPDAFATIVETASR